jgi:hypothetical protein
MKYLLFEHGKIEKDRMRLEEFYTPFYVYYKKSAYPQGASPQDLSIAINTISNAPNNYIGLGIFINERKFGKIKITFSAIKKDAQVFRNANSDYLYILSTSTLDEVQFKICRYDYARYSDGRWVIYLLTDHESNMPIRIPAEE